MVLPVVCGVLLVEFTGQINSLYKRATNMFFFSSGVHSVQELDNAAVMEHYFSQWTANSNVLPSLPLVKANCSVLRCPRDIPMNSQIAGFSCIRTRILCDVYTYDTGVGFVSSCCSFKGCRFWGWGPDTLKYVGVVRVGFDPLKCHIRSFKTVAGKHCKFHNMKDERLVPKTESKTNFSRRLKQFDGLTWLSRSSAHS